MKIKEIRVENYKGYLDSGWLKLADGFTVIVGQNNSGKTALLEAFKLKRCEPRHHRSLSISPELANPRTKILAKVQTSGSELSSFIRANRRSVNVPVPSGVGGREGAIGWTRRLFEQGKLSFAISTMFNVGAEAEYPSHGQFEPLGDARYLGMNVDDTKELSPGGLDTGRADNLADTVADMCEQSIYVFRAERMTLGTSGVDNNIDLAPHCANLAAVLQRMQGVNKAKFDRFNEFVSQIFPTIKWISIAPVPGNICEIRIWSVDLATERDDLAIPLNESGTGVGQVLAILYVAMTSTPRTIVIDEPNSFLHPGAAKKLMQILRQHNHHQYVISTHSAELISAIDPETMYSIRWIDGASQAKQINSSELQSLRGVLADIGVTLADVFAFDRIVWVEGATEQECFPVVLRATGRRLPPGVGFVAVRAVGDFQGRRSNPELIVGVYRNLSRRSPLIPGSAIFSFDREKRTDAELERVKEKLGADVYFLKRATYENYLLHRAAIASVLSDDLGAQISATAVSEWFVAKGIDLGDAAQLGSVDAPELLGRLFKDLSGSRVEFRKTSHSVALTKWLLANDTPHVKELEDYVVGLCEAVSAL